MADPGNSSLNSPDPKKPMSMETRLIVTFVLVAAVLLLSQTLFKAPKPLKKAETPKAEQSQTPPPPPALPPQASNANASAVGATAEQPLSIDTNLFHVEFTNKGGAVKSWRLKKYRDRLNHELELVNPAATAKDLLPFQLVFTNSTPAVDPNFQLFQATPTGDGLGVDYVYTNAGVTVKKSYRFLRDSYAVEVVTEVTQNGTGLPHLLAWRGGFGDPDVQNAASTQRAVYVDADKSRPSQVTAKDAKNGPVTNIGNYPFAGLEDTYFSAVYLPKSPGSLTLQTYSDNLNNREGKEEAHVGAAVGGGTRNQLTLFVGPKDTNLLREVNPKLSNIVDFGFFGIVARPIFAALNWTHEHVVRNWGWAIILVTTVLNMVILLPFKLQSLKSSRKMGAIQPQVAAINAKYKDVKMNDPRKQDQNAELMELYKKNGVNPAGGCVPMLLQIPFFYAFYQVLTIAIELRGAHWLWVNDLSQPEALAIRVLPVTMLLTQLAMQKLTPVTVSDPAQQKMMYLMPLMMGYFFYWQPAGLVLYWLTGNVIGIVQQYFFNRAAAPNVIPPPEVKKRPGNKR